MLRHLLSRQTLDDRVSTIDDNISVVRVRSQLRKIRTLKSRIISRTRRVRKIPAFALSTSVNRTARSSPTRIRMVILSRPQRRNHLALNTRRIHPHRRPINRQLNMILSIYREANRDHPPLKRGRKMQRVRRPDLSANRNSRTVVKPRIRSLLHPHRHTHLPSPDSNHRQIAHGDSSNRVRRNSLQYRYSP